MPLQNRVDPFGELFADPARGTFMGNRGGRFHTPARTLTARRWASRQWICCVLTFKGRHRDVWGQFYTELFFLDEPTALAAGHRPCFECRRQDADNFAEFWRIAHGLRRRPRAAEMDQVLHRERLQGRAKRRHRRSIDGLAGWRRRRAGRRSFRRPRRCALALDAAGLRCPHAAAAARHRRGLDTAGDCRCALGWLSPALARERERLGRMINVACNAHMSDIAPHTHCA